MIGHKCDWCDTFATAIQLNNPTQLPEGWGQISVVEPDKSVTTDSVCSTCLKLVHHYINVARSAARDRAAAP